MYVCMYVCISSRYVWSCNSSYKILTPSAQAEVYVDLCLSALDLHNPDGKSYHTGLADEVLLPMWREKYLWVWDSIFRRVAQFLLRQDTRTAVTIVVYCKSGKHRASA